MKTLFENFMNHLKEKTSQGAMGSIGLFGVGAAPSAFNVQEHLLIITQKDVIFVLQAGALLASIFVAVLTSVAWFEKRSELRKKKKLKDE